ncbi:MAG: winged helix-turn-helix transcriptional regulator, partial [Rhodobacteraceae bacterium]|nr:winged helix-turn-helix transcriptional regulator [Paracoccaceae bacterium]
LARRFDAALRPHGLTNGQFSLLMALNRPEGPRIGDLVPLLGMDRTTLTAALKPLERRGLVSSVADAADARARRLVLTTAGIARLKAALPAWRAAHDAVDATLDHADPEGLRQALRQID